MYENIDKLLQERDNNLLTRDNILNRVSEYHVFAYYLGFNFTIGKAFTSPFRKDKTPSFCVFRTTSNNLMYKDFATGDTGDMFSLIERKYGLNFYSTLLQINKDFNLKLYFNPNLGSPTTSIQGFLADEVREVHKGYTDIQIQLRKWEYLDIEYWQQFGIDETLLQYFRVFPTAYTTLNGHLWSIHNKLNPCYAYLFKDKFGEYSYKLYKPLETDKTKKWICNANPEHVLQGYDRLAKTNKILIITKSLKDVIVLRTLGFQAIAVQAESILISEEYMRILKLRFEKIYLLFDFDLGGIKGAKRFRKKYPEIYITFLQNIRTKNNGCKDISDARKKLGYFEAKQLLLQALTEAKNSGE